MTNSAARWRSELSAGDGAGQDDWLETQDWIESLRDVTRRRGPERVSRLLQALQIEAQRAGIRLPVTSQTPYDELDRGGEAAALPGRSRAGAADQEHHPLERDGDGGRGRT